jgi:hypothetical protein
VQIHEPGRFIIEVNPLTPSAHPDAMLYIYNRMKRRALSSFFWDKQEVISFHEFMNFFNPSEGKALLAVLHKEKIIGAAALTDFLGNHRAQIGIWLEPTMRGVNSHIVGKQILTTCHTNYGIRNLYGFTPWFHAKQYALRCGMQSVCEIPDYCKIGGRVLDLEVFRSEKSIRRFQHFQELIESGYEESKARQAISEIYDEVASRNEVRYG